MKCEKNDFAVIGLSGVFPKANNIKEYWNNMLEGKSGISFYTNDELLECGISKELIERNDYIKARGDISNMDMFDSKLFKMSAQEANITDPQHRIMLECAYTALEDAGCNPYRYSGKIGIFAGCSMNSYLLYNIIPNMNCIFSSETLLAAIGNDKDSLTSTIAYRLNLKGPAITIQSSSSTSLTAICLACQSLANNACDMALAGGVSVGPPIKSGYLFEEGGILSSSGLCRPFDKDSDGFVPGSGCGVVVLKRLEDAIVEKDNIYAVIKGYAVNNDGSNKVCYSAPSVLSQAEVIRDAIAMAGVSLEDIRYIESHGTGTRLGDAIEFDALHTVFADCDIEHRCAVGSIKSSIGHLDAAAGVAGFIKTCLMLYNKKIVGNIEYNSPNPHLGIDESRFYIPTTTEEWVSEAHQKRTAGVSSFGMGGTNAHVILQEYIDNDYKETCDRSPNLMLFSANTHKALNDILDNMFHYLKDNTGYSLNDISYTLYYGRQELSKRVSFVCDNVNEMLNLLSDKHTQCADGAHESKKIVFLFAGQGHQSVNMFKKLYENNIYFKKNIDDCFTYIKDFWQIDIKKVLYPVDEYMTEASRLVLQTEYAQCILFCVQYAMAKLFMSMNIIPDVMIGHGLGEYVAACISGVMSMEDTIDLLIKRSRLMSDMEPGAMLAINASVKDVSDFIDKSVSIACINNEKSIVLAGTIIKINTIEEYCRKNNIFNKRLSNQKAFHSNMTQDILYLYRKAVEEIILTKPLIPFVSNVTGDIITAEEATSSEYWVQHMKKTVLFYKDIKTIDKDDVYYIDICADNVLGDMVINIIGADNAHRVLSSYIENGYDDIKQFYSVLGKLWENGFDVNLSCLFVDSRKKISIPTYPFERISHWYGDKILSEHQERIEDNQANIEHNEKNAYDIDIKSELRFIFKEVLGEDNIDDDESFFEYGGNSLMAIAFLAKLNERFDTDISLSILFEFPTINSLYRIIDDSCIKESYIDDLFKDICIISEQNKE